MFLQLLKQLFTPKTEVRLINPEDPLAPYLRVQCTYVFNERMQDAQRYVKDTINYGMDESAFKLGNKPITTPIPNRGTSSKAKGHL